MANQGDGPDKNRITFASFELTISAVVFSAEPPASFQTHPDEPVSLNEALEDALAACGLHDRLEDVAGAVREFVRPRFVKTVQEFEEMRRRALLEGE